MGCSIGMKSISSRLSDLDQKVRIVLVNVSGETHAIDTCAHNMGLFHTNDITDNRYKYYENRSTLLSQKLIKSSKKEIVYNSKEALVLSIIRHKKLSIEYIDIIKRKGLDHNYRWSFYKTYIACDENRVFDLARREKLIECYFSFMQAPMIEAEDTIKKDVVRTEIINELFATEKSVGTVIIARLCKGLAGYFPHSGYIQGMNFVALFISKISGLNELDSFCFLAQFFSKEKNLYFGIYEEGFPLLRFLCYTFHVLLHHKDHKLNEALESYLPDELYISKWILTFFCGHLTKPFLLRIWDFLLISDVFGCVFISLEIVTQMKSLIMKGDLQKSADVMSCPKQMSSALDFTTFIKKLKVAYADHPKKQLLNILESYASTLDPCLQKSFEIFYRVLKYRLSTPSLQPEFEFKFINRSVFNR